MIETGGSVGIHLKNELNFKCRNNFDSHTETSGLKFLEKVQNPC